MTSNKVPFTDEKQDPQDLPATLRVRFTSPIRILLPLVGIMHVKLILDYLPLKLDYISLKLFRCVILSRVINCERMANTMVYILLAMSLASWKYANEVTYLEYP